MNRRQLLFSATLAAVASPARAQPAAAIPMIGYLSGRAPDTDTPLIAAFKSGLADFGYVAGRNVEIEYVSSNGQPDRLPGLAADLVRRRAALIFASSTGSAVAAKAATTRIPIVFTGASDPVGMGLVATLGRPGGNMTGVTMFSHTFAAKRLELLHELAPDAEVIAILSNPQNLSADDGVQDLQSAARSLRIRTVALEASNEGEIDAAFALIARQRLRALFIVDDPFFTTRAGRIGDLARQHSVATMSAFREFPDAGALASYGTSFAEVHRQCGIYAGRILKGAAPGELPVILPSKFAFVINLKSAEAIGLTISPLLLVRADDVIE